MPDEQSPPEYPLPLTGRRNGHYKQLIGYARVQDDQFTQQVLVKKTWHLTNAYSVTNVPGLDGRSKRVILIPS